MKYLEERLDEVWATQRVALFFGALMFCWMALGIGFLLGKNGGMESDSHQTSCSDSKQVVVQCKCS